MFYMLRRVVIAIVCVAIWHYGSRIFTSFDSGSWSTSPVPVRALAAPHEAAPATGVAGGKYPDTSLTPGALLNVTADDVCRPGYSSTVRDVSIDVKREVYARYHVAYVRGEYEVDHFYPLELGGSNSIRNLWVEPYDVVWNAKVKDRIENRLHELVCNHQLSLQDAQRAIGSDWVAAYRQYLGPTPSEERYYPHYARNF